MRIFCALVHHPVLNKRGEVVTTALTNVDIHDIARSARTYGVEGLFVVTPVTLQLRMIEEILGHWTTGAGASFNERRAEALRRVTAAPSLSIACAAIEESCGKPPLLAVTSAMMAAPNVTFDGLRARLPALDRPLLIAFGTGWGMTEEVIEKADLRLPAIVSDPSLSAAISPGQAGYNHLSVRAAAAIVLDRLLGQRALDAGINTD